MKNKVLIISIVSVVILLFRIERTSEAQLNVDDVLPKFFVGENVFLHWNGTKGDPGLSDYENYDPISGLYKDKLATTELFCAFPDVYFLPKVLQRISPQITNEVLQGYYIELKRTDDLSMVPNRVRPKPTTDTVYARIVGRGPTGIPGNMVCSPAVLRMIGIEPLSVAFAHFIAAFSDKNNFVNRTVSVKLVKRTATTSQLYRDQKVPMLTDKQFGI